MEAFIEATELDPDCVDAWFALAKSFYTVDPARHIDSIVECAENALRAQPNNAKSKSLGAAAFLKKGELAAGDDEWSAAYWNFKRAYSLDSEAALLADDNSGNSASILEMLAWSAERAGEFQDCVINLRARVRGMPGDRHAKYILGRTLTKMAIEAPVGSPGREELLNEAEAQITEFLLEEPLSAEANYFLGYVYVAQGRTRLAADIVAKLADIDIDRSRDLQEVLD